MRCSLVWLTSSAAAAARPSMRAPRMFRVHSVWNNRRGGSPKDEASSPATTFRRPRLRLDGIFCASAFPPDPPISSRVPQAAAASAAASSGGLLLLSEVPTSAVHSPAAAPRASPLCALLHALGSAPLLAAAAPSSTSPQLQQLAGTSAGHCSVLPTLSLTSTSDCKRTATGEAATLSLLLPE